jgi:hypothetical protein
MVIDPAASALMARTPRVLRSLLVGLPEAVLDKPNDEGWSVKDIVVHLLDVESIAFVERIERMLGEERPFIRSIQPDARLVAAGYRTRRVEELLDDLERQRTAHVAWLERLSADQLQRVGEHDEVGEITVSDIAHQWAAHDMSHLRQTALMLQQHLAPLMGATRGFYDV